MDIQSSNFKLLNIHMSRLEKLIVEDKRLEFIMSTDYIAIYNLLLKLFSIDNCEDKLVDFSGLFKYIKEDIPISGQRYTTMYNKFTVLHELEKFILTRAGIEVTDRYSHMNIQDKIHRLDVVKGDILYRIRLNPQSIDYRFLLHYGYVPYVCCISGSKMISDSLRVWHLFWGEDSYLDSEELTDTLLKDTQVLKDYWEAKYVGSDHVISK